MKFDLKSFLIVLFIGTLIGSGAIYLLQSSKNDVVKGGYTYNRCESTVTSAVAIGGSNSVQVLSAKSGRSYARVQLALSTEGYASSSPFVSFSSTATVGNGMELSTTTPYLEFGMSTNNPYTGIVSVITDVSASTTILVIECR